MLFALAAGIGQFVKACACLAVQVFVNTPRIAWRMHCGKSYSRKLGVRSGGLVRRNLSFLIALACQLLRRRDLIGSHLTCNPLTIFHRFLVASWAADMSKANAHVTNLN